jgi:hypothetical protein
MESEVQIVSVRTDHLQGSQAICFSPATPVTQLESYVGLPHFFKNNLETDSCYTVHMDLEYFFFLIRDLSRYNSHTV